MIIYLTGQPGVGKTTLAQQIQARLSNAVTVDGDRLREITGNYDYTPEGRLRNLEAAHSIALFLSAHGWTPIIAMVSPFRSVRENLKQMAKVTEFYLTTDQQRERSNYHVDYYEPPMENYTHIDTGETIQACIHKILTKYHDTIERTTKATRLLEG